MHTTVTDGLMLEAKRHGAPHCTQALLPEPLTMTRSQQNHQGTSDATAESSVAKRIPWRVIHYGVDMQNTNLMTEMIEQCRSSIVDRDAPSHDQPPPLRRAHLLWMCDRMVDHVDDWPATKLNRWIGFIQCAMIANRLIDLEAAKEMFNRAKNAFGEPDEDLVDHLDPDNTFQIDIGGQG